MGIKKISCKALHQRSAEAAGGLQAQKAEQSIGNQHSTQGRRQWQAAAGRAKNGVRAKMPRALGRALLVATGQARHAAAMPAERFHCLARAGSESAWSRGRRCSGSPWGLFGRRRAFVDGQFAGFVGSGLRRWVTRATVSHSTCNRPDLQGCLVVAHPPWILFPLVECL